MTRSASFRPAKRARRVVLYPVIGPRYPLELGGRQRLTSGMRAAPEVCHGQPVACRRPHTELSLKHVLDSQVCAFQRRKPDRKHNSAAAAHSGSMRLQRAAAAVAALLLLACSAASAASSDVSFLPSAGSTKFTNVSQRMTVAGLNAPKCHSSGVYSSHHLLRTITFPPSVHAIAGDEPEEPDDMGGEDQLPGAIHERAVLPAAGPHFQHRQQRLHCGLPVLRQHHRPRVRAAACFPCDRCALVLQLWGIKPDCPSMCGLNHAERLHECASNAADG